jgi:hypothetical protein
MPTVNEELLHRAVRHQVQVQHMIAGTSRNLQNILADADQQILAEVRDDEGAIAGHHNSANIAALMANVAVANHDAHSALNASLRQVIRAFMRYEAVWQKKNLTAVMPVKVKPALPSPGNLDAIAAKVPIRGRTLKRWLSDFEAARLDRVEQVIRRGMVGGLDANAIGRLVRAEAFPVGERQLHNVVRTVMNFAANAARLEFASVNGAPKLSMLHRVKLQGIRYGNSDDPDISWMNIPLPDVYPYDDSQPEEPDLVGEVQWHATLDESTCDECADMDGELYEDSPEECPLHPSCRCFWVTITRSWARYGLHEATPAAVKLRMNGVAPKKLRYSAWLKAQDAATQDEALGPTRGKLFRIGKLPIGKFTDSRHQSLTLEQLKEREGAAFKRAGL